MFLTFGLQDRHMLCEGHTIGPSSRVQHTNERGSK